MKALFVVAVVVLAINLDLTSASRRSESRNFHAFDPENCQLEADPGNCRALIPKWYYDGGEGICKTFNYGGCGGNANKFQTKWMCERKCKPTSADDSTCPMDRCRLECPQGFVISKRGCQMCRCRSDHHHGGHNRTHHAATQGANCPAIDCSTVPTCPNGYTRDADGCQTCDCRPARVERSRTGAGGHDGEERHHGAGHNEHGSGSHGRGHYGGRPGANCTAITPCTLQHCPFGNKRDESGCPLCECKTKVEACGVAGCMMECPGGFKTDRRGCDVCACRGADQQATHCRPKRCPKRCAFGLEKDSMGCDLCVCSSRRSRSRGQSSAGPSVGHHSTGSGPSVGHHAESSASVGHHSGSGPSVGHHTGNSGPSVGHHSSSDRCGVRPACSMYCPNGYKHDEHGCLTSCGCADEPSPQPVPGGPSQRPAQRPAGPAPAQIPAPRPVQPIFTCAEVSCNRNKKACTYGFQRDENGCVRPTCACAARPSTP